MRRFWEFPYEISQVIVWYIIINTNLTVFNSVYMQALVYKFTQVNSINLTFDNHSEVSTYDEYIFN